MIRGVHTMFYTSAADELRAFLRDKLGFSATDVGHGWLIFDLPEAESELVAGFHTEYSGLRFGLFFIAEYLNMITVACIGTLLFLGGWNAPSDLVALPGIVWFVVKAALFIFLYIWLRTTLPRFRYDRLMAFGWKFLLPVATLNLMVTAAVVAAIG